MKHRAAQGYGYLVLLFTIAFIGGALGVAGEIWHTQAQREREVQLIWIGHQYRRAIEAYWRANGGSNGGGGAGPVNATIPGVVNANSSLSSDPTTQQPPTIEVGAPAPAPTPLPAGLASAAPGGQPGALAGRGRYPASLDDLLLDSHTQQIKRYLRKRYPDPITGKDDWVPILSPGGGVMGVRSVSDAAPIKRAGFSPADIQFTGKEHYSDWTFVFVPPVGAGRRFGGSPAAGPVQAPTNLAPPGNGATSPFSGTTPTP